MSDSKYEYICEVENYKGKEYVVMDFDVFYNFFNGFMELRKDKDDTIDKVVEGVNKQYNYAKSIKRKRIRLKKQKEVMLAMYNILFVKGVMMDEG